MRNSTVKATAGQATCDQCSKAVDSSDSLTDMWQYGMCCDDCVNGMSEADYVNDEMTQAEIDRADHPYCY